MTTATQSRTLKTVEVVVTAEMIAENEAKRKAEREMEAYWKKLSRGTEQNYWDDLSDRS